MASFPTYRKFWLVWNTRHHLNTAKHRHYEKGVAVAEAVRLADQTPGHTFVVLEAVQSETVRLNPFREIGEFSSSYGLKDVE